MGALDGIKVLDLTRLLPGGFCTQLLADFGADVVKVEDTGLGDYIRWAPPYLGGEDAGPDGTRSALYLSLNRNKRSIRIDLKNPGGLSAFMRLAKEFDVLVEGFRPGVMDRLGAGYESLRDVNPGLIYCAITGYGQDGPNAERAGHDQNYLALNGILGLTGSSTAGPAGQPAMPGVQIADVAGGAMTAAFGILAALRERDTSGEGQFVDISMTDGALSMLAMVAGRYFVDGEVPERGRGQLSGGFLCYMPYEAADGWVSCGALEPKFWSAFCNGVDRPDLIEHQFAGPESDAWEQVAAVFRSRTKSEWARFNDEHDCCIEPILNLDEALRSQLVHERGMTVEWEQPGAGAVRQLGNPVKLSRTGPEVSRPAPGIGEHTREILIESGFEAAEVNSLTETGAIGGVPESAEPKEGGGSGNFRF